MLREIAQHHFLRFGSWLRFDLCFRVVFQCITEMKSRNEMNEFLCMLFIHWRHIYHYEEMWWRYFSLVCGQATDIAFQLLKLLKTLKTTSWKRMLLLEEMAEKIRCEFFSFLGGWNNLKTTLQPCVQFLLGEHPSTLPLQVVIWLWKRTCLHPIPTNPYCAELDEAPWD